MGWNTDVMVGTPITILDQEMTLGMEAACVKAKIIRSLGFCHHRVTHHTIPGLLTSRLLVIERLKYYVLCKPLLFWVFCSFGQD